MVNQEMEEAQEMYATLVEINQEPTELYKILKFENIVSGGGEAKQVISDGYVYLNGVVETRKRKKVYAGDLVSFNGQYLQIALKGETQSYEFVDGELMAEESGLPSVDNFPQASPTKKVRKAINF